MFKKLRSAFFRSTTTKSPYLPPALPLPPPPPSNKPLFGPTLPDSRQCRLPKVPKISFRTPDPSYFAALEAKRSKQQQVPRKIMDRFRPATPPNRRSSNPENPQLMLMRLAAETAAEQIQIESSFEEWVLVTGWHGIADVFYAHTLFEKVTWALILTISVFLSFNSTISMVREFRSDARWVTKLEYKESRRLEWPNITLRNLQGDSTMETRDCNETLLHCGLNSKFDLRSREYSCCQGSLSGWSTDLNLARIFKKDGVENKPGYDGGIYFLLGANSAHQEPDDEMLHGPYQKPSNGFVIYFYHGDELEAATSTPIFVGPGTRTAISIGTQRQKIDMARHGLLTWDSSELPCVDSGKEFEFKVINSTKYTSTRCRTDCKAEYLIDKFNCTCQRDISLKNPDLSCSVNHSDSMERCLEELQLIETAGSLSQFAVDRKSNLSYCVASCLDPCEYDLVTAKASSTRFPRNPATFGKYLERSLHVDYSLDEVKSLALVEIYFESNKILVVEKSRRDSLDNLIGSIGGSWGVWTGISVISLFQAAVYVVGGARTLVVVIVGRWRAPEPVYTSHNPTKIDMDEEERGKGIWDRLRRRSRRRSPGP